MSVPDSRSMLLHTELRSGHSREGIANHVLRNENDQLHELNDMDDNDVKKFKDQ